MTGLQTEPALQGGLTAAEAEPVRTLLFLDARLGPGLPEAVGTHILQLTHAGPPGIWAAKLLFACVPAQPHLPRLFTPDGFFFLQKFPGYSEVQSFVVCRLLH